MSKLIKKLAEPAIGLGIGIVISIAPMTGLNFYLHHNVNYEDENKKIIMKADGILNYTELYINKKTGLVHITRNGLNYHTFTDDDGDSNVDEVANPKILTRSANPKTFYNKNEDLKKYPSVFKEADKEFKQQMQRFKIYTNK
jgi:hypothetical protein